ncbi:MAG: gliding motility-associated ABC transporter ATP-binding subunit GldA [Ginsengibacter sp.]
MSIEVTGLTKIYGNQKAIDNISFKVGNGEIVGFLGPNGAGKSTTIKIITGFLQANKGEAFVNGLSVKSNSIQTKKKTGYLPESNPLYYDMYVREYLEFIFNVHRLKKEKKKKIEEVITLTGLSMESSKKIGQLSKGYKQRVGLAAALIHDPEVLILDEPTSGLDPNQIVEIRELIKILGKNKTVLFSSHILQEVEAICDRVIIINNGHIVADDKLSNLQSLKISAAVIIKFSEYVDKSLLENIEGVQDVEQLRYSGNISTQTSFKLQTTHPQIVRKKLMELALKNNLNIVSLQNENHSLEDVFKNLTA